MSDARRAADKRLADGKITADEHAKIVAQLENGPGIDSQARPLAPAASSRRFKKHMLWGIGALLLSLAAGAANGVYSTYRNCMDNGLVGSEICGAGNSFGLVALALAACGLAAIFAGSRIRKT